MHGVEYMLFLHHLSGKPETFQNKNQPTVKKHLAIFQCSQITKLIIYYFMSILNFFSRQTLKRSIAGFQKTALCITSYTRKQYENSFEVVLKSSTIFKIY